MKRVATALVLIPLVVWVVLAAPFWVFAAVLAAVGLLAFHEFDRIAQAQGIQRDGRDGRGDGSVLLRPSSAAVRCRDDPGLVDDAAYATLVAMAPGAARCAIWRRRCRRLPCFCSA